MGTGARKASFEDRENKGQEVEMREKKDKGLKMVRGDMIIKEVIKKTQKRHD